MLIPEAPQTDKMRQHWERNLKILLQVFEEDFAIGEKIQSGVRHNPAVRLGLYEKGLAAFHAALDRALGIPVNR
jgi:hypothetical protein